MNFMLMTLMSLGGTDKNLIYMIARYIIASIVMIPVSLALILGNLFKFITGIVFLIPSIWFYPWWSNDYYIFIKICMTFEFHYIQRLWKIYMEPRV